MFSVRYQTPSADAEEIHPKWWGDGGRDGHGGREKQREERNQLGSFSFHISAPLSVRSSQGQSLMCCIWAWGQVCFLTEETIVPGKAGLWLPRLTMQQGATRQTEQARGNRHFSTHSTPPRPWCLPRCPRVVGDCLVGPPVPLPLPQMACLALASHAPHPDAKVPPCSPAPEPSICTKKPLPLDEKFSCIFPFST